MLRLYASLLALVALVLVPERGAHAFGEAEKFAVAQIVYPGHWNPRPSGPRRLVWEVEKRTSIESAQPVSVKLSDEAELRKYPFLYLAGDQAFPVPDEADLARLRRHLAAGGMLLIDGADGGGVASAFDRSVRALTRQLFPKEPLEKLPSDHVIYKAFYLLRAPVGRTARVPYLEAVTHDGRAAIVYSQNDLGGAWARDEFGQWEHEVYPGGPEQREMAFRLGINLVMYALCLDYKTDQVHVPFILRRRKWQSR
jgi:hypothetical protein